MTARETSAPLVAAGETFSSVTDQISDIALVRRTRPGWWLGFGLSGALVLLLGIAIVYLLARGVGIWGVDMPAVWGFALINYVWWIAIASGGTLISAILYLVGAAWRTSIARIAESMMVFAAACAGIYPLIHMGRPWLFYWLAPYPDTMTMWPQFRSPLLWDFVAILVYIGGSVLFWYVGLLPDLATLRDRASLSPRRRVRAIVYGILALGWRGSAAHWRHYKMLYLLFAGLLTPTVVSIHSVVGLDFAAGIIPGWHSTQFPPFFVFGAMLSGFAMVTALVIPIRRFYRLHNVITPRHIDLLGMMILASSLAIAYAYAMELFTAFYGDDRFERMTATARLIGPFAPFFWSTVLLNVAVPQLLWRRDIRLNQPLLFVICVAIFIGMWLERYLVVVTSEERDFMPSAFFKFVPTFWDWATFLGTIGLFLCGIFLFLRFLPIVSIAEMRALIAERHE